MTNTTTCPYVWCTTCTNTGGATLHERRTTGDGWTVQATSEVDDETGAGTPSVYVTPARNPDYSPAEARALAQAIIDAADTVTRRTA